jgi:hypothetical protein
MVMTKKLGRIRAIGSTSALFFHPGNWIQAKYPHDTRTHMMGAIITGEQVMQLVGKRQQFCCLATVLDVDGKCHIVKYNFHVSIAPEILSESKHPHVIIAPPWPIHHENDCDTLNNIAPNVRRGPGLGEHITTSG